MRSLFVQTAKFGVPCKVMCAGGEKGVVGRECAEVQHIYLHSSELSTTSTIAEMLQRKLLVQ